MFRYNSAVLTSFFLPSDSTNVNCLACLSIFFSRYTMTEKKRENENLVQNFFYSPLCKLIDHFVNNNNISPHNHNKRFSLNTEQNGGGGIIFFPMNETCMVHIFDSYISIFFSFKRMTRFFSTIFFLSILT